MASGGAAVASAAPPNNGKALASLILGIVGLVCSCGPFAGVPAIILGNMAKKEIAASGGTQGGGGLAQAGFILGIIASVLWVLIYIFYFLFFILLAASSHSTVTTY